MKFKFVFLPFLFFLISFSGVRDLFSQDFHLEDQFVNTPHFPSTIFGRNIREVIIPGEIYHPLQLDLTAVMEFPSGLPPFPGVVILHGSGGLFVEPHRRGGHAGEPCTEEIESKFTKLKDLFLSEGVAVIMPASFYSRDERFCEDNDPDYLAFAPSNMDDRAEERIAGRSYDLLATMEYFCSLAQVVTAISPGCGFHGAINFGHEPEDALADLYYPLVPLFLEIGTKDDVPDECTVQVKGYEGRRELQALEVKARLNISKEDDDYNISLYPGVDHDLLDHPSAGSQIETKLIEQIQEYLSR